ncbi:MAG: hypothetical protein KAT13_03865, partial [Methanosarcinales archaeon]|jgi:hypothetical protein|nr:hypothetical protein [Methanosarcinales archaeon]
MSKRLCHSALEYKAARLSTHKGYRTKGERISEMPYHTDLLTGVAVSDRSVAVNIKNVCINQYGDIIGYTR